MKYYLFQERPDKIQDNLFKILLRNEPTAVELTKQDYEIRMGIRPARKESKKVEAIGQPVGKNPKVETSTPFSGTRGEAIKILRGRGFEYKDLKTKKRDQLIEMI